MKGSPSEYFFKDKFIGTVLCGLFVLKFSAYYP